MKRIFIAFSFFIILSPSLMAKELIKFGYLADPSHEAVMWALKNGKVTSDIIEVKADALQIPALIQATVSKTYDVIQTAGMAIPRARSKGLDLRIVGTALRYHTGGEGSDIWVKSDFHYNCFRDGDCLECRKLMSEHDENEIIKEVEKVYLNN